MTQADSRHKFSAPIFPFKFHASSCIVSFLNDARHFSSYISDVITRAIDAKSTMCKVVSAMSRDPEFQTSFHMEQAPIFDGFLQYSADANSRKSESFSLIETCASRCEATRLSATSHPWQRRCLATNCSVIGCRRGVKFCDDFNSNCNRLLVKRDSNLADICGDPASTQGSTGVAASVTLQESVDSYTNHTTPKDLSLLTEYFKRRFGFFASVSTGKKRMERKEINRSCTTSESGFGETANYTSFDRSVFLDVMMLRTNGKILSCGQLVDANPETMDDEPEAMLSDLREIKENNIEKEIMVNVGVAAVECNDLENKSTDVSKSDFNSFDFNTQFLRCDDSESADDEDDDDCSDVDVSDESDSDRDDDASSDDDIEFDGGMDITRDAVCPIAAAVSKVCSVTRARSLLSRSVSQNPAISNCQRIETKNSKQNHFDCPDAKADSLDSTVDKIVLRELASSQPPTCGKHDEIQITTSATAAGQQNKPTRESQQMAFFVELTDSDSDQSDAECDDDDDWDSPTASSLAGVSKSDDEFGFCFSGIYIPLMISAGGSNLAAAADPVLVCSMAQMLSVSIVEAEPDVNDQESGRVIEVSDNGEVEDRKAMARQEMIAEVNARWRQLYSEDGGRKGNSSMEGESEAIASEEKKTKERMSLDKRIQKRVRFSSGEAQRIPVPNELEWAQEYASARVGTWQIDRQRFEDRANQIDRDIGWVFGAHHRARIYNTQRGDSDRSK